MSTSRMTDIFISYASEDRDRARTIASALQARGWSVWWDRDIKTGQAFDQAIEHELDTAKRVVVLWSKDSIASDWVKSEAAAALQRGVLLPALIDNVKLPLEFSRRQTADLIDWDGDTSHAGFQALCDAMAGIVGVAPVPTPDASENRQAPRDAWNQRLMLKRLWQRTPSILTAAAILVAALVGIVAALNRARTPNASLSPTAQVSQILKHHQVSQYNEANQPRLLPPLPRRRTGTSRHSSLQMRLWVLVLESGFLTTMSSTRGQDL